ncbi:MAG: hypothetical protein ACREQV_01345, partial [Candidatus Binatia bacterium]
ARSDRLQAVFSLWCDPPILGLPFRPNLERRKQKTRRGAPAARGLSVGGTGTLPQLREASGLPWQTTAAHTTVLVTRRVGLAKPTPTSNENQLHGRNLFAILATPARSIDPPG